MNKTEFLNVEFYEASYGWLSYKIKIGNETFEDSFSEVFDPLHYLKEWLEKISCGIEQTSFSYDNEGAYIRFHFQQINNKNGQFTILDCDSPNDTFINKIVEREQLVKEFYLGLMNFAKSDKYDPKQWEYKLMKERLCKILNKDEQSLINELLTYNRNQMTDILFNLIPENETEEDEFDFNYIAHIVEWDIPKDYDNWEKSKKKEYIIESINESISPWHGMKLSEFQSDIIENFIK